MTGSFCGLAALCADLNDLFRGSFNVNESAAQLKVVSEATKTSIRTASPNPKGYIKWYGTALGRDPTCGPVVVVLQSLMLGPSPM